MTRKTGECPLGTHATPGEAFACGRCSAVVRRAQREEVRAEREASDALLSSVVDAMDGKQSLTPAGWTDIADREPEDGQRIRARCYKDRVAEGVWSKSHVYQGIAIPGTLVWSGGTVTRGGGYLVSWQPAEVPPAEPAPVIRSDYPNAAEVAAHATHEREGNPAVGHWLSADGYLRMWRAGEGHPQVGGPFTPVKLVPCAWPTAPSRTRSDVLEELGTLSPEAARLVAELAEVTDAR